MNPRQYDAKLAKLPPSAAGAASKRLLATDAMLRLESAATFDTPEAERRAVPPDSAVEGTLPLSGHVFVRVLRSRAPAPATVPPRLPPAAAPPAVASGGRGLHDEFTLQRLFKRLATRLSPGARAATIKEFCGGLRVWRADLEWDPVWRAAAEDPAVQQEVSLREEGSRGPSVQQEGSLREEDQRFPVVQQDG